MTHTNTFTLQVDSGAQLRNTEHLCACEDTFNTSVTPWLSLGCLNDKGEDTVQGITGANQYHADQSAVEYWSILLLIAYTAEWNKKVRIESQSP